MSGSGQLSGTELGGAAFRLSLGNCFATTLYRESECCVGSRTACPLWLLPALEGWILCPQTGCQGEGAGRAKNGLYAAGLEAGKAASAAATAGGTRGEFRRQVSGGRGRMLYFSWCSKRSKGFGSGQSGLLTSMCLCVSSMAKYPCNAVVRGFRGKQAGG